MCRLPRDSCVSHCVSPFPSADLETMPVRALNEELDPDHGAVATSLDMASDPSLGTKSLTRLCSFAIIGINMIIRSIVITFRTIIIVVYIIAFGAMPGSRGGKGWVERGYPPAERSSVAFNDEVSPKMIFDQ